MAYTWSNAGDLLTLTDNFAGSTSDVTFTDTYTAAHQLAGETSSNAAYVWTPPPPTGRRARGHARKFPPGNHLLTSSADRHEKF